MTKLFVPLVLLAEAFGLAACVLIGLLMGRYLGGFAWDGSHLEFNLHPLLMTTAMIFLYGNGIMIYRIFTGINLPRIAIKLTHTGTFILATVMMTVGLVAVFQFHNQNGMANMYSLHSWLGLATIIMFLLQIVLGLGIFLLPFASSQLRASYLSSHVFFGIAILSMSAATCLLGITENVLFKIEYSKLPASAFVANGAGLCIVAFVITVSYIITREKIGAHRGNNYSPLNN